MKMSLVDAAAKYVDQGISLIPCYARSKYIDREALIRSGNLDLFRRPVWGALQRRLPTDREIQTWFGDNNSNLAIVTGFRELLIIDFDDASCFDRWSAAHRGFCSSTCVQRSGRGYHVLFYWSRVWSTRLHTGIGFELLGEDGRRAGSMKGASDYVVAWPSTHPSGRQYQWFSGQAPWEKQIARISSLEEIGLRPMKRIPEAYFVFLGNAITHPRWGSGLLLRWLRQRIGKARGAKTIY